MIIAGIDVGLAGAIAFLDTVTGAVRTVDMPVLILKRGGKVKREVDGHRLAAILGLAQLEHAFIEDVHARARARCFRRLRFRLGEGPRPRCADHPQRPLDGRPAAEMEEGSQRAGG